MSYSAPWVRAIEEIKSRVSVRDNPRHADVSRLSEKDIENVERSKNCRSRCPGAEACPHGCLIFGLDTTGRQPWIRTRYCAAFGVWKYREHIERIVPSSKMPPRLKECVFASFLTERVSRSAILAKRTALSAGEAGETIVLAGETGVGKTHLAAAIVNYVSLEGKRAILVSFAALLNDMRSVLSVGRDNSFSQNSLSRIFEALRSADCLALDDVGQEVRSDYADSCLYQIVNDRYNAKAQLVVTTNYPTHEALAQASPRGTHIVRRLREMGHWVRIEAEAYRGRD
jgi:DNA replication protein DnaC